MHHTANEVLQRMQAKWPRWNFHDDDCRYVDLEHCKLLGKGPHEIAAFSFGRYIRRATRQKDRRLPICIQFGMHFPDYVSEQESALGALRSTQHESIGMPERTQLLFVASTNNGRAFWKDIWERFLDKEEIIEDTNSRRVWINATLDVVLEAFQDGTEQRYQDSATESPPESACVALTLEDFPEPPFQQYSPTDDELASQRQDNWIYQTKKALKKGTPIKVDAPERVALCEDIRRIDSSLYIGQLGWIMPESEFVQKTGSSGLFIQVAFDSGVTALTNVYWLHFLKADCADTVALKMLQQNRGTPFDADPGVAKSFIRDLPFFDENLCRFIGNGPEEIYAYSYRSCLEEAEFHGDSNYPIKIGYTADVVHGALERINGQFPQAIASDACALLIGRCDHARRVESHIHRVLKSRSQKIKTAPGDEWYLSSVKQVEELFHNAIQMHE